MGESGQGGDVLCRCVSIAAHASASGYIEGERVVATSVQGGISLMLASTMHEFCFITLKADAISLAIAPMSGSIVTCSQDHFIVHKCTRSPATFASNDVAAVPLSQLLWTASPAVSLPQLTDTVVATCSYARTIAFGSVCSVTVYRLEEASSDIDAAYACIRTLYLPRGMRILRVSMNATGDHVCWFCDTSCLVQLVKLPFGDQDSSLTLCAPAHILHHRPVTFVSWLQPPGAGMSCSNIELDDVIISADATGCILLSKLMQCEVECGVTAVTCARINVPSLCSITCVLHAPGSSMHADDSILAFVTLDASAKLAVWSAKGIVKRRLPLLPADGVTPCIVSESMSTNLPTPPHSALDILSWAESSISSHDASSVDPSVLCVIAYSGPFFTTSTILSATASSCTALTGITHRGRILQLEAQSLGGLMLSRDITGGVIVWYAHEQSSALLPRYWASARAATLVQLRPSDTFGAAVLVSSVDRQPSGRFSFDVTILIDDRIGVSCGSFSEYTKCRVEIPSVSATSLSILGIKSWKFTACSEDRLITKLGCLIDTDSGVWFFSFERETDTFTSSEACLFADHSVAACVGLGSNGDSIWSIASSGSISRAVCDRCDQPLALQHWAQLPDAVERSLILVHSPDSMTLCVISRTNMFLYFDCNSRACLVAKGSLTSFPNNMQCWSSCSGSIRICCVYDGHLRIYSLGTESIYSQHLVHFTNSGANLGAVLDDKLYTSSFLGISRLDIDLRNNICFSPSPRRFGKTAVPVLEAPQTSVVTQDAECTSDNLSDTSDAVNPEFSPSSNDEHSTDPSSLSWVVPWFTCLKSKVDYCKVLSSAKEEDKISALSGLLHPSSSISSSGDWMAPSPPQPLALAAPPARFTNMKERRANLSTIGAVLSAHSNGSCQYMWQCGWFVAWAAFNEEQPQLLNELSQIYEEQHGSGQASGSSGGHMSWACASWCGVPLWLNDTSKLSQLLMACGRATFLATKDAMECVLIFVLIGQKNALLALMRANKGSESNKKFQEFLACDSDNPDFRARACKNALRLISQHRYSLACALFLLANDISSAMDVAANRLGDVMLAVAIARLHSKEASAAFSQEHEDFIVEALGSKFPAATTALLYRQGRSEEMMRHLILVCDFGLNQSDSNVTEHFPLLSTFDLMLFINELLVMPQIQRWKLQTPSLSEVCSELSISCEKLCVICCRIVTVASGECVGPHVAFVIFRAFHVPPASASRTFTIHPSLQSFFLTSLCGWLDLDPMDISYSLSSMPVTLVDTVMRLMHNEERHFAGISDAFKPRSVSLSLQTICQSRLNFHLLPNNMRINQRWRLLLSSASANVSSFFRFASSVQACVLSFCFPSVCHTDITEKSAAYALTVVKYLLANCPLRDDETCEQQMLQFCSSWLDIVYNENALPVRGDQVFPDQEAAPFDRNRIALQLPRLDVVYETSPTHEASLVTPAQGIKQNALPIHSVPIHSAFWAQCIGENILQLLQVLLPSHGDIAASLQPFRLFLLQEMRCSGISLNTMNAFAFERYASPPEWLQELVSVMNGNAAVAARQRARCSSASPQTVQSKPQDKTNTVFSGNAKDISNVLSCRRRVMSNTSNIVPVFGPIEEVACTREMIRSIALISALSDPCIVAAGTNILAEIKLSPKGSFAGRISSTSSKSIESVVSSGLKKLGNSLFAKVYSIGSPTPAPSLFDDEGGYDNVTMIATSSWNCVCKHPTFPLYVTGGNSGSQSIWSSGSNCALSHITAPWASDATGKSLPLFCARRAAVLVTHAADSSFSHDGRLLSTAFSNGGVAVWEFKNSQAPPLRCSQQFTDRAFNVMWLNEGSQLLCTGYSKGAGCVSIVDLLSPSRSRPSDNFINSTNGISSACFVRSGSLVALGFRDGGISLCDLRMRASVTQRDSIHSSSVRTIVAPPHGSWMASSGSDGHVQVLDSMFLSAVQTFENQHPRGTYFHSGSTSLAHFGVTDMVLEGGALWTCGADGRVLRRTV